MRIADRYDRFNDRLGAGKAGAAASSAATQADARAQAAKAAAASRPEPGVLSVQVSDRAASLSAGSSRLDELKSQIANGTFKIDAKAIAKSLVGGGE